jgi:hypothetical protein
MRALFITALKGEPRIIDEIADKASTWRKCQLFLSRFAHEHVFFAHSDESALAVL